MREGRVWESLGEDVGEVVFHVNIVQLGLSEVNSFTDIVVTCVDVVDASMERGVLREYQGATVIAHERGGCELGKANRREKGADPSEFLASLACGNVLGLTRGKSDYALLVGRPSDHTKAQRETVATDQTSGVDAGCKVRVCVSK